MFLKYWYNYYFHMKENGTEMESRELAFLTKATISIDAAPLHLDIIDWEETIEWEIPSPCQSFCVWNGEEERKRKKDRNKQERLGSARAKSLSISLCLSFVLLLCSVKQLRLKRLCCRMELMSFVFSLGRSWVWVSKVTAETFCSGFWGVT